MHKEIHSWAVVKANSIFISYRRADTNDVSGRIYDRLETHFGKEVVFKDVFSIPYGEDFPEKLNQTVGQCQVMIAIIGPQWLEIINQRLNDSRDWVRLEIETGLNRNIPVIPLLVNRAKMPKASELPDSLKAFSRRNATEAGSDPLFDLQIKHLLIPRLEEIVGSADAQIGSMSLATQLRWKKLQSDLQNHERDFLSVAKEVEVALDPLTKNKLNKRLEMIAEDMDQCEQQIRQIESDDAE